MDRRTWWSVLVEFEAPDGASTLNPGDERLDRLMDAVGAHDGIVSAGDKRLALRVSVESDRHDGALGRASEFVMKALVEADLPEWPIVRVEAVRQDQLALEIAEPPQPEVLGAAEVARLLGVSRQRLAVIRRDHVNFPRPFMELAATPLWYRSAIEEWLKAWSRRPGAARTAAIIGTVGILADLGDAEGAEALVKVLLVGGTVVAAAIGIARLVHRSGRVSDIRAGHPSMLTFVA